MTLFAFLLILSSVVLHVSWNLLSKASRPSAAFYLLTSIAAALSAMPLLHMARIEWSALPAAFWWHFAWACCANILYYTGLFLAYKRSDISVAYPLVRALPVIFTAVLTTIFGIGKPLSPLAFAGMFVVFCGCLFMPLGKWSNLHPRFYFTPVLGYIVLAALGTTGYTIFDNLAIPLLIEHASGGGVAACGAYMAMLECVIAVGLLPYLFRREEREAMAALWRSSLGPYLSGVFTTGAYLLVLLAMPRVTNVSFVTVFRQMGLPMGVAAGMWLLKEKCSWPRLTGIAVIVLGLAVVAFA